jgi:hypothetical protein
MSDSDVQRRDQIREDYEAIQILAQRWYEAEIAVRIVIENIGSDLDLERAHSARDRAAGALMRSVSGLLS